MIQNYIASDKILLSGLQRGAVRPVTHQIFSGYDTFGAFF